MQSLHPTKSTNAIMAKLGAAWNVKHFSGELYKVRTKGYNKIFVKKLSKINDVIKRSKYSSAYRFGFSVRRGHLLKFIELRLRM